jgi:hypothetical protein
MVLRQAGAVYQFRHAAPQDHLAAPAASTIDLRDTTWTDMSPA